jgi:hypothetical protein
MPKRVQRKRTKGWRMPPNTVYVGRPTKWGNPYVVGHIIFNNAGDCITAELAVEMYERYLRFSIKRRGGDFLNALRGKDLACWCPLDSPCHADVLLRLANEEG